MYTSPDDARSDLFLSVGVYLFGPLLFDIVFQYIPLTRIAIVGPVVQLAVAAATTVLVPYLLMRYRDESFTEYGLSAGRVSSLGAGALAAAPLVVATLAATALGGGSPLGRLPLLGLDSSPLLLAVRLVQWVGTALLAAYCTVKARDAFRSDPATIRALTIQIGRVIAIAMAVAAVLLLLGGTASFIPVLLLPLGALGCVAVALASVRGPSSATRAVLLTPTVVLALRAFNLTLDGRQFFLTLWLTGIVACLGLVIGIYQEWRNSAMAAVGVGLVVGLLTNL